MNTRIVTIEKERQDAFHVRKIVFVDEQNVPLEEEIDQFEDDATHFVLYDEEKPVGAGRFRVIDDIGKVERICVLSTHRSKGAGKIIMNKIEEFAKEKGISTLKLHAQTHAENFYKKLGYETASPDVFLDAGIPHVTMEKGI
ncbi:GNAT family N-acetyltransferase [Ferdinandcohnia quinoae]|uniref:GNAT family N-acetyltransferase n=1 Tax=Fredinandcohnia quinoae TaxID=2918902 RepID=A0AAW5E034_9BACI|nr:GNAT family N-acetyltransferase [Fredinandcohnia sp. SECRCQ15]MCH1626267.1 GNAT family N-acetyltransferase [Fredinandcohnia sp. SECRCQ15]